MWNLSRGAMWTGAPKEWSALAAWVIYVVMLVARRRTGWGGRRAALLGIAGFVIVVFTFFSLSLVRSVGGAA
jgi:ABC-type transport system involved in cytochrome c biogenesis permease subunit